MNSNFSFYTAPPPIYHPAVSYEPDDAEVQSEQFDVAVDISLNDKGTVASAVAFVGDERYATSAITKVNPGDKFNPEIGRKLAAARVLNKLANRLQKQADGLVKHQQDMKEYRKRQKEQRHESDNNPLGLNVGDRFRIGTDVIYTVAGEPTFDEHWEQWAYPITWEGADWSNREPYNMRVAVQHIDDLKAELTRLGD